MIDQDFDRTIDPFEWKPGLDAAPDFVPTAEYNDLLYRCDAAYAAILTGEVLNYRLVELKEVVEEYTELFEEVEKCLKLYEGFDRFYFLFDAVFTAFLFVEKKGWDAYFALDDYSKFDMNDECHVINWLRAYEALNKEIAYYLHFNTDCDCKSKTVYRISHIGIHVNNEDLDKIFQFSILYGEHYARLLQKYMTITWDKYHTLTREDEFYYVRDNLIYYILKSRNKDFSPFSRYSEPSLPPLTHS